MAKKSKHKRHKKKYATNPEELLIREKSKKFLKAEREYWKVRKNLQEKMEEATNILGLKANEFIPNDLSSIVWGLKDGVSFVRYKSVNRERKVEFRILPITLEEWGRNGLIVPVEGSEISLAKSGLIQGIGTITLSNCSINNIHIPYVEISHLRYGDDPKFSSVEQAILDFQLTLLGLQIHSGDKEINKLSAQETIESLEKIANQFELLLENAEKEEELQKFLKEHSFILHPSAQSIPKQKLGEDFVTDFVLVATTTQGPTYILVELERTDHKILTKDYTLTSAVNHAIKQTRDWDVWLENNKAYIQNKLPGFESPTYMIVIGRSKDFDEKQKAYMRSYNREWKNLEIITYDDVLLRFRSTIDKLKEMAKYS